MKNPILGITFAGGSWDFTGLLSISVAHFWESLIMNSIYRQKCSWYFYLRTIFSYLVMTSWDFIFTGDEVARSSIKEKYSFCMQTVCLKDLWHILTFSVKISISLLFNYFPSGCSILWRATSSMDSVIESFVVSSVLYTLFSVYLVWDSHNLTQEVGEQTQKKKIKLHSVFQFLFREDHCEKSYVWAHIRIFHCCYHIAVVFNKKCVKKI